MHLPHESVLEKLELLETVRFVEPVRLVVDMKATKTV